MRRRVCWFETQRKTFLGEPTATATSLFGDDRAPRRSGGRDLARREVVFTAIASDRCGGGAMVNVKPNQKLANTRTYHVTTIRVATVKGAIQQSTHIYDILIHTRPTRTYNTLTTGNGH